MMIGAVDPGGQGSITTHTAARGVRVEKLPRTVPELWECLCKLRAETSDPIRIYVENVQGNAGGNRTAQQGMNFGLIYGALFMGLLALEIDVIRVTPGTWQKALGLGKKSTHGKRWKHHLQEHATNYFPELEPALWAADSLLIFLYGYRIEHKDQSAHPGRPGGV